MRFQEHLQLQKQHADEQVRQMEAQRILDEAATSIHRLYQSRTQYRDPIAESKGRIRAMQRRAASATASSHFDQHPANNTTNSENGLTKSVDPTTLNPASFKLYRKLRLS